MKLLSSLVERLPRRNYGFEGLPVHVDTSALRETYFVVAEKEIPLPVHAHGAQYPGVVSASYDCTADGHTVTHRKGDTYLIPAGKRHQITLHAGYVEMDYDFHEE